MALLAACLDNRTRKPVSYNQAGGREMITKTELIHEAYCIPFASACIFNTNDLKIRIIREGENGRSKRGKRFAVPSHWEKWAFWTVYLGGHVECECSLVAMSSIYRIEMQHV